MRENIYAGKLVRLGMDNPEGFGKAFSRWVGDSEFIRLLDDEPARRVSVKSAGEWLEKDLAREAPDNYFFLIHASEDDRLIGFIGLGGLALNHGEAYVGIGLGERTDWGKGYGTDAMRVILRYAFTELNLRRVSLGVFAYNPRAIRSYEKAGFVHEGRIRGAVQREGQHWDEVHMGILREEWLQQTKGEQQ